MTKSTDIEVIAQSPLFDEKWYLDNNSCMGTGGLEGAEHYLLVGAYLGRNPGPDFGSLEYVAHYRDVANTGMNPLLHYEIYGRTEGRKVHLPGLPRVTPAQAVAASRVALRDWRMTQQEAEGVVRAEVALQMDTTSKPRSELTTFDEMAARRYAAAVAALYDANCAALKATVVMPTYNRGAQVGKAVRSVLAQSHRNIELLVVDDGSTDDTRLQLARFADDPRLRVLRTEHQGISAARNTGLKNATGDYIFYLDSDSTWINDYLILMLAGLRTTGVDFAYSASCITKEDGELEGYRGGPFDWISCLSTNYIDINVVVHRKELIQACGGFDTDLRRMVDLDLILRYTKGRQIAFFPFIGCLYPEPASGDRRHTVSQPSLYRKLVAEKNRLELRSASETFNTMSLSFGIKIAAPYDRRAEWGDFHYAESLAEALVRLGHSARIDFRNKWYTPKAQGDDVALVMRGLVGYKVRPDQLTLMWNISHPDQISYDEYAEYDGVLVASRSWAALLTVILGRPIFPLLQCTDTERFYLPAGSPPIDPNARGLFVGNSRSQYRQMVRWSVENNLDIDIYGAQWGDLISSAFIAGENVSNMQLGEKYRSARFVLNDHWESMKDFGFISNRVFDVVASGGHLISDHLDSVKAIFGDAVETVDSETTFVQTVSRPGSQPECRRAVADYVKAHHSFDARAQAILTTIQSVMTSTVPVVGAVPNFAAPITRRRVGLLMHRGRSYWTSSAYIRLIGPLTTDYAHECAGLDIVALDSPDDPRLESCDICIVQRVAVAAPDLAKHLIARLRAREVPLYVDTDDAFFLHNDYRAADVALRLLMEAAQEVWFSTETLAGLYKEVAAGKSRIRRNDLDPRFWLDYRNPVGVTFDSGPVRFVYMGTATHHDDFEMVMPALERLARNYPGQVELSLVGVTSTPPKFDWLNIRNPPRRCGSYPAFARFAVREVSFDVGIAPLKPSPFNAAKSDIKFLDYSAMGLLSIVSEGAVYQDCIEAGLALGCAPTEAAWYEAMARVVDRREDFASMRERAAKHLWQFRNVLKDPSPLADLLK